jgi:hypothetical protein
MVTPQAIVQCKFNPPKGASEEAKDFVAALLVKDPSKRLGFNNTEEVKNHRLFRVLLCFLLVVTFAEYQLG